MSPRQVKRSPATVVVWDFRRGYFTRETQRSDVDCASL
jgi:hypothetical protein